MSEAKITVTAEDLASSILDKIREVMNHIGDEAKNVSHNGAEFGETLKGALENPLEAAKNLGSEMGEHLVAGLGEYGVAVGAAVGVTALLVTATIELAEHAREVGGEIGKMATTTGMSVAGVSALRFAMQAAGSSLDDASRSTFMLEQRMENSSKKVSEGLAMIGLSINDLKGMNKDQWLVAVSEGFRSAGEETNKAAAAMDIFGRAGRDMLPVLMKDLGGLVDKSHEAGAVWAEDDVAAVKKFNGELNELKATTDAAWTELGLHVSIADEFTYGYNRMKLAAANVALTLWDIVSAGGYVRGVYDALTDAQAKLPTVAGPATDALKKQGQAMSELALEDVNHLTTSEVELKDIQRQLTISAEAAIEVNKKAAAAAKKRADEEKKFAATLADVMAAGMNTYDALNTLDGAVEEGIRYYLQRGVAVAELTKIYGVNQAQVKAVSESIKQEEIVTKSFAKALDDVMKGIHKSLTEGLKFDNKAFETNLDAEVAALKSHVDAIDKIYLNDYDYKVSVIKREQQAKKDALNEYGAHYQEALDAIDVETADKMGLARDEHNRAIADMSQAIDQWGTLVTSWMGKLPGLVQQAFTGGGGIEGAVKASLSGIGENLGQKLFEGPTGLGQKIASGLSGKGLGSSMAGMLGGAVGSMATMGLSLAAPLVMKGIEALVHIGGPSKQEKEGRGVEADFEKQYGGFDKMMKAVGSAYEATGRGAKAAEADVKALMDAEKKGGDAAKAAIDKINGAFADQKQDEKDLQSALQEYHFSIEELGPALQKQQLGEQSTKIMNQFRLLAGAGIEVGAVEDKMSGNINAYLQAVIKTGQEVPAAMKPMLEKMAEEGKLTDENGNKITDLKEAGVNFAETMSSAADRIVKGFNDVLVKIGMIPAAAKDAASKVPPNPFAGWVPPDVNPGDYGPPPGASTGGLVTAYGIEHFDTGGANGRDTIPAMLSPHEMILNPNQQRAVGALMSGGGASNAVLEQKVDKLNHTLDGIRLDFQTLPIQLRHALRGTR